MQLTLTTVYHWDVIVLCEHNHARCIKSIYFSTVYGLGWGIVHVYFFKHGMFFIELFTRNICRHTQTDTLTYLYICKQYYVLVLSFLNTRTYYIRIIIELKNAISLCIFNSQFSMHHTPQKNFFLYLWIVSLFFASVTLSINKKFNFPKSFIVRLIFKKYIKTKTFKRVQIILLK